MSRMSSWNRPSKHSAIPPPYYITVGEDTPYCQTCGRVMNTRKPAKNNNSNNNSNTKTNTNTNTNINTESKTPVKYCSERCRRKKPGILDRDIEKAFVSLLDESGDVVNDEIARTAKSRSKKGDSRILVKMDDVEQLVFGHRPQTEKTRRGKRNVLDPEKWRSVDMESSESEPDSDGDAEDQGGVDVGVGGQMEQDGDMVVLKPPNFRSLKHRSDADETRSDEIEADKANLMPENIERRDEGQKRAEHKEMVRRAARRGVVFGFVTAENPVSDTRRKCEAVVNGLVVEPSFAKGNWGVRWRE